MESKDDFHVLGTMLLFCECPFYHINCSQRAVKIHCHQEVRLEWGRGNNYSWCSQAFILSVHSPSETIHVACENNTLLTDKVT